MKYNHTSPFVYGYNPLVIASHNPELMGLNFAILKLGKKTNYCISLQKETLAVLLTGSITFTWNNHIKKVKRDNPFHDSPSLMHFDSFTECRVINDGDADCEIIIISTDNPKHFEARMYMPEDLASQEIVGETLLDGKTKRMKRVFFDRTTRPETNIFCGELVNFPGCWACFPPHLHTEPEIYFYRFLPEMGYGFSEQGDEVFKVKHNDLVGIPDGKTHSQVTAPGYAGYIFWAQRLQDNGKNIDYRLVSEHAWVEEPDAVFFPDR
ncbi:MAG: 5-deoxy-glucuronate isomerase [Spirochaetota bacterium]|nr:5-deoxy-glucuronate isomerase [Spirochaetota bacterium]